MSLFKAKTPAPSKSTPAGGGDQDSATPHARKAEPLAEGEKHDQLADKETEAEDRQEALLDEGLEESFPSSDPVSVKHIT